MTLPAHATRSYRGLTIGLATLLAVGSIGCGALNKAKNVVENIGTISDFAEKIGKSENLTYTAEYKLSNGDAAKIVQKPPQTAYIGKDGSLLITNDTVYNCNNENGKTTCTKRKKDTGDATSARLDVESIGAGFIGPEIAVAILVAAATSPDAKVEKSSKKVAGQSSECIKVTNVKPDKNASDELKDFTVCITDKGILSEFSGNSLKGEKAGVTLTKFSDSADDSAFQPPAGAEIKDLDSPAPASS
jgi:hypothetical protein